MELQVVVSQVLFRHKILLPLKLELLLQVVMLDLKEVELHMPLLIGMVDHRSLVC